MIFLDGRIGSGELYDDLNRLSSGSVELLTLPCGDLCWEGHGPEGTLTLGLERKRLTDIITCIETGRYTGEQLPKMLEAYSVVYLLIEGLYRPSNDGILETYRSGGWEPLTIGSSRTYKYDMLEHFLCTVELKRNVIIKRSSTKSETSHMIWDLYTWWQKEWDSHTSIESIKLQSGPLLQRNSLLRRWAAELPGIGTGRSKYVAEYFHDCAEMANARVRDWMDIRWESSKGRSMSIGPKTAQGVWEAIRERNDQGTR